jgi:AMIN domain-containing protein
MPFSRHLFLLLIFTLFLLPVSSPAASQIIVRRIDVSAGDPLRLQVETSARVAPQAQIISDPERLVIDVPNATPASSLRNKSVNRSELERVRVGLFSNAPPVTRIVLDLNSPQWYRIAPTSSGFSVILGAGPAKDENTPPTMQTIGWVSGATTASVSAPRDPFVVAKAAQQPQGEVSPVRVQFSHGLLEIHTHNAPLSEVLFQIQKQTGAEISMPPGAGEDPVVADLGPAAPSEVLSQLLNGSDLNFVVVGSESDPNALHSIILTAKSAGFPQYPPADAQQPPASSSQPDDSQAGNVDVQPQVEPQPEDVPQPQPDAPQN